MERIEEFSKLTGVVRGLMSEGRARLQTTTYKKIAKVLQIEEFVVPYKTLSIFKKEDVQDVLKKNKPLEFIGYDEILPDGTVTFLVHVNQLALGLEKTNRLTRLNTGSNTGVIHGKTISYLIKNNPNIDVEQLIMDLQKKC